MGETILFSREINSCIRMVDKEYEGIRDNLYYLWPLSSSPGLSFLQDEIYQTWGASNSHSSSSVFRVLRSQSCSTTSGSTSGTTGLCSHWPLPAAAERQPVLRPWSCPSNGSAVSSLHLFPEPGRWNFSLQSPTESYMLLNLLNITKIQQFWSNIVNSRH